MVLYHYYDASMKPFQNLSDVSIEEARKILKDIASKKPDTQCAKRTTGYIELRHHYEDILRCEFMKDSHPTFSPRVNDGKEYRKKLYTYDEILGIIEKYGYPQDWNNDGKYGPERYIEAHIWSDDVIQKYV